MHIDLAPVRAAIELDGWYLDLHEGAGHKPDYGCTVGLAAAAGRPEIILLGLPDDITRGVLEEVVAYVQSGEELPVDEDCHLFLNGCVCRFLPVAEAHVEDFCPAAKAWHGDAPFTVLQMVWPDQRGRFPWDRGVNRQLLVSQPLLSEAHVPEA